MAENLQQIRILDMYSGLGSWVKPWYESVSFNVKIDSVDILKLPHVNFVMDMRDFKPNYDYHIVYASPPCNKYFSRLRKTNKKEITEEDKKESFELANLAFEYGKRAKLCYIIENPYTGLMPKFYPDYKIVDYSQYGYPMRKRTAIWSNLPLNLKLQKEKQYNRLPLSCLGKLNKSAIPIELSKYVKRIIIRTFNEELQQFKKSGFEKPGR